MATQFVAPQRVTQNMDWITAVDHKAGNWSKIQKSPCKKQYLRDTVLRGDFSMFFFTRTESKLTNHRATMKYLALAMLLCVLMSLSDCQCIFKLRTPEGENQTHCQDGVDLTWHPKDTKWRNSECQDCTCDQCCYGYATPTRFPEDCVSVFDPKACQYVVHKKDNSSVLCPIFAAVGK